MQPDRIRPLYVMCVSDRYSLAVHEFALIPFTHMYMHMHMHMHIHMLIHIYTHTDRTCTGGSFQNIETGTCVQCSSTCVDGCSGFLPITGDNGCDRCRGLLTFPNGTQVRDEAGVAANSCQYNELYWAHAEEGCQLLLPPQLHSSIRPLLCWLI